MPHTSFPPEAFRRLDESPDEDFYQVPRLVTHIDEAAIEAVTQLYREIFPENGAILDLMSSWISHLPEEISYRTVSGLGMNAEELRQNERLTDHVVHDLNADPSLPYPDQIYDGAGICVSIDYLVDPISVLTETARVLKPGAPLVITFSNRCFPTKAIAIWHQLTDRQRMVFVKKLLEATGQYEHIRLMDRTYPWGHDPLLAVVAHTLPIRKVT